jgi:hypothetical protein
VRQFGREEPRPAAHVHDAITGCRAESLACETAPSDRVAGPIDRLEPLRGVLVENELTHLALLRITPTFVMQTYGRRVVA